MLLLASPAFVLPLVILILADNPTPTVSPVDQAIEALPVAGGNGARLTTKASLPDVVGLKLYAQSARPDAAFQSVAIPNEAKVGIDSAQYEALHPLSKAGEDFMVGQLELVFTSPLDSELSNRIFKEFCNAQPGDPFYNVGVAQLPISGALKDSLVRWTRGAGATAAATVCPRLSG